VSSGELQPLRKEKKRKERRREKRSARKQNVEWYSRREEGNVVLPVLHLADAVVGLDHQRVGYVLQHALLEGLALLLLEPRNLLLARHRLQAVGVKNKNKTNIKREESEGEGERGVPRPRRRSLEGRPSACR
jgi:hypothetical protein